MDTGPGDSARALRDEVGIAGPGTPSRRADGAANHLGTRAWTVFGGSDEAQRTIVAEAVAEP